VFILERGLYSGDQNYQRIHIARFHHETVLPFDARSPRIVWKVMSNLRVDGKLLLRNKEYTRQSFKPPYVYQLYLWGGKHGLTSIFPSYDIYGQKMPIWYYGRLDKKRPVWNKPEKDFIVNPKVMEKDKNTTRDSGDQRKVLHPKYYEPRGEHYLNIDTYPDKGRLHSYNPQDYQNERSRFMRR